MAEAKRKLAAILSADVVGHSRLMGDDEAVTVETLTKYRAIFTDHISRHDGRLVDSPGDNRFAEFASPVEALSAAVDIRELPPKSTAHDYFTPWEWDGSLARIHHTLYLLTRDLEGREANPSAGVIDSQSVKSTEKRSYEATDAETPRG